LGGIVQNKPVLFSSFFLTSFFFLVAKENAHMKKIVRRGHICIHNIRIYIYISSSKSNLPNQQQQQQAAINGKGKDSSSS